MSHDSLSALLDGECSAEELDRLLEEMERSPELKQAYSRLCLAREVAEGTRVAKDQPCICAGVMARLEVQEPASARVVDLDSRRRKAAARFDWKPWAGFAAAASVAAVAILVSMPPVGKQDGNAAGTALSNTLIPEVSAPQFAPISVPFTRRSRDLRAVAYTPEQAAQLDELNNLMMEHSSADQGMAGTLRYARVAAHSAAQEVVYHPEERR